MSDQEKNPKITTISFSPDGTLGVSLEAIESVGIANILDLKAYNMNRTGNRIMHIFEYDDGGSCELTILLTGHNIAKLEVFQASHVSIAIEGGTKLTISKFDES